MNWSRETFLAATSLDEFEFEVETRLPLTVIQNFNFNGIERFDGFPENNPPGNPSSKTPFEAASRDFWERFRVTGMI